MAGVSGLWWSLSMWSLWSRGSRETRVFVEKGLSDEYQVSDAFRFLFSEFRTSFVIIGRRLRSPSARLRCNGGQEAFLTRSQPFWLKEDDTTRTRGVVACLHFVYRLTPYTFMMAHPWVSFTLDRSRYNS